MAERFAFLGPFETNQLGSRALYLWVALPMENPGGSSAPTVFVDGAALNLGEGNYSAPGNRRARFFTAAGSDNVTRMALRIAVSWGFFTAAVAQVAQALVQRIQRFLLKLTH